MNIRLVVVRDFGAQAKGDVITDAALISEILADERAAYVVRIAVPAQEV
jgi:hypothetical protein